MFEVSRKHLSLAFLSFVFFSHACSAAQQRTPPKAVRGVLDLRGWDFERDGIIDLHGEWEFYWEQLLEPKDFIGTRPKLTGYFKIPGTWHELRVKDAVLPSFGYATFRLIVKLPRTDMYYGISVGEIMSAFKLFDSQRVITKMGIVGKARATMYPQHQPVVGYSHSNHDRIELVLQISNFVVRFGGLRRKGIKIGSVNQIARERDLEITADLIPLGILLFMSLYHIFLFLLRSKDQSTLIFGLLCAVLALNVAITGQNLLLVLFPTIDTQIEMKLFYLTFDVGVVLILMYLREVFYRETPLKVIRYAQMFGVIYLLFTLASSYKTLAQWDRIIQFFSLGCTVFAIYVIILATIRKREGAFIVVIGAVALLLAGINEVLVANKVYIFPSLLPLGFVTLLFSQALLLTMRFTKAFTMAETLSTELEQKVRDRTSELLQAYEKLAEHDQIKSQFFANISHELRTPLTLLVTPIERLLADESEGVPPAFRDRLRSMAGNAHRLLRLVNQLLDFSRIESGVKSISFTKRDLRPIVASIVEGFQPFAHAKKITLSFGCPEHISEVYIDEQKFEKIVCNLLSNACKFTEPQGRVEVFIGQTAQTLTVAVQDTGIGIAKDNLTKIFERFHQIDSGPSRRYEGSGIGLSLSRELAKMFGGQLEVESELGQGSRFTLSIPLGEDHIKDPSLVRLADQEERLQKNATAAAEALAAELGLIRDVALIADTRQSGGEEKRSTETSKHPQKETKGISSELQTAKRSGEQSGKVVGHEAAGVAADMPTVLVVEDNEDMRSLIVEILEGAFHTLEAANGKQGLKIVQLHRPELVISDVMMPEMDGNQLLSQIRDNPETASIPVILLTAKADQWARLEGLERGADDYIAKPFQSRELLARARNLVRLQLQEKKLREINLQLKRDVIEQTTVIERARKLQQYLPQDVAKKILDEEDIEPLEQKRRPITVFHVKLHGIRELAGGLEPEELMFILNSYFSRGVDIAFEHGATIDKLNQASLVGFFGAPMSRGKKEDAQSCARMALDLFEQIQADCLQWSELAGPTKLIPTIVLASGHTTVGNFGSANRLEYTAVGGAVDEAEAIMETASRGVVICGPKTMSYIKESIKGIPLGEVHFFQSTRPIPIFKIGGIEEKQPVVQPSSGPKEMNSGGVSLAMVESQHGLVKGSAQTDQAQPRPIPSQPNSQSELKPGVTIHGRFEVKECLGESKTNTIFRAWDQKLEMDVALKMLRLDEQTKSTTRERFYREIKIARMINHPNVARIYDLGTWNGQEFMIMEYIAGKTLRTYLLLQKEIDEQTAKSVLLQICNGLAAAHVSGIVHRDMKPENIMIEKSQRVVILDFGIARWLSPLLNKSMTHGALGTPFYMAPEQFTDGKVDQRADIYALGLIAFEIFTGQRAFLGDSIGALAEKHININPPNPIELKPDLSPMIAAVILRCLEKKPKDRFASVREMIAMLTEPSTGFQK